MNENPNATTSLCQKGQILSALEGGARLTHIDALQRFGCARLAARIGELRREGHDIKTRMIALGSRQKKVAQYFIK